MTLATMSTLELLCLLGLSAVALYLFIKAISCLSDRLPTHETSMVRLQTYIRNMEAMESESGWVHARHGARQRRKVALEAARKLLNKAWDYSRWRLLGLVDRIEADWRQAKEETRTDVDAWAYAGERLAFAHDRLKNVAEECGGGIFCDMGEARRRLVEAQRMLMQSRYEDAGEMADTARLQAAEAERLARDAMVQFAVEQIIPVVRSAKQGLKATSPVVVIGGCEVTIASSLARDVSEGL